MSLYKAINNAHAKVAQTYTPSNSTIVVDNASVFGSPSPGVPIIITTSFQGNPHNPLANYTIIGINGNVLTIGLLTWGTDTALSIGDIVDMRWTAEHADQIGNALNSVSSSVSIGNAITGSSANEILITDSSGNLSQTAAISQSQVTGLVSALSSKAGTASPALTGTPTAPTPSPSDNTTKIATTAYVQSQGYLTTAPVTLVAGRTGSITLSTSDIGGLGSIATHAASDFLTPTGSSVGLSVFVASGSSHAPGIVPDTPNTSGNVKFLREDAIWATPSIFVKAKMSGRYGDWVTETDASTVTINMNLSDKHTLLSTSGVGSSRTLQFSNFDIGQVLILEFIQASSGGPYTIVFPTILWANGTPPATTSVAGNSDTFMIIKRSDGSYAGALSIPNY